VVENLGFGSVMGSRVAGCEAGCRLLALHGEAAFPPAVRAASASSAARDDEPARAIHAANDGGAAGAGAHLPFARVRAGHG
jgi:hypothetical protein